MTWKLRTRLFGLSIVLLLLIAAAAGLAVYLTVSEEYRLAYAQNRRRTAEAIAAAIEPGSHGSLTSPASIVEPAYERYGRVLNRVADSDPTISRIFTLLPSDTADGLVYAVDAPFAPSDAYRIESDAFMLLVTTDGRDVILWYEGQEHTDSVRTDLHREVHSHEHHIYARDRGRRTDIAIDDTVILTVDPGNLSVAETPAGIIGANSPSRTFELELENTNPREPAQPVELTVNYVRSGGPLHLPGEPFFDDAGLEAEIAAVATGGAASVVSNTRSSRYGRLIRVVVPISESSAPGGVLVIESFEEALSGATVPLIGVIAGTVLVIGGAVGLFTWRFGTSIVGPIRRLHRHMAEITISSANFDFLEGADPPRADMQRGDEIGDLARGFSSMRRRLAALLSERSTHARQLRQAARQDHLTGVGNRTAFFAEFDTLIREHEKSEPGTRVPVALFSIDVDNFKEINDSVGHKVADTVLAKIVERLSGRLESGQAIYRTGGDEFVVVVVNPGDKEAVAQIARGLINAFRRPIIVKKQIIQIAISVGISMYPENGREGKSLVRAADFALTAAKQEKPGFSFYDAQMRRRSKQRRRRVRQISDALGTDAFFVDYQPKVNAAGAMVGAEALLRWNHPTEGRVPPGEFVPIAEDSGLIVPLGLQVLRTAVRVLPRFEEAGRRPVPISVNLSLRQFQQPELVESIEFVLSRADVAPELVTIEITESMVAENADMVIRKLEALRALGICISIDDFGTGYSSLSYLKSLPADEIKIDRSFVMNLPEDRAGRSIVTAVVNLARDFDLDVVAEGVETQAQQELLAELGCTLYQGYLFAKPLGMDALLDFGSNRMWA
mgnify:CR=1 FL=1